MSASEESARDTVARTLSVRAVRSVTASMTSAVPWLAHRRESTTCSAAAATAPPTGIRMHRNQGSRWAASSSEPSPMMSPCSARPPAWKAQATSPPMTPTPAATRNVRGLRAHATRRSGFIVGRTYSLPPTNAR